MEASRPWKRLFSLGGETFDRSWGKRRTGYRGSTIGWLCPQKEPAGDGWDMLDGTIACEWQVIYSKSARDGLSQSRYDSLNSETQAVSQSLIGPYEKVCKDHIFPGVNQNVVKAQVNENALAEVLNCSCPSCDQDRMYLLYKIEQAPTNSVLLFPNPADALTYPKGDITLGFCTACGFITNTTFDQKLTQYSEKYEATQSCSPTFNSFNRRLALHLIEKYNLRGKDILEIGCGQGEFLNLLCDLGDNRGLGFDPAYRNGTRSSRTAQLHIINDFYSEQYGHKKSDFICCKMTFEHVHNTAEFINMVRRSVGEQYNSLIFFQVPSVDRILRELAFWDIYYEHCSYFSKGSLARLFLRCGFDIIDVWQGYDDQYLMLVAKPSKLRQKALPPEVDDLKHLTRDARYFAIKHNTKIQEWRTIIKTSYAKRHKVVLWGSSSKSVAFLNTLEIKEAVQYVVDINPNRQGTFMAGTGQEIVSPDYLQEYKPDLVIIMNPVYYKEIKKKLSGMSLFPKLMTA